MVISTYWTLLTVFIIVLATRGSNDFIQTELFSRVEKELGALCPKVDICNRNSSEPNVLPNGLIGTGNERACCQGCSCHERCHEHMNCCFPDDDDDTFVEEDKFSAMECLYVRTGTPDETWPRHVPAYRIVSSAPKGGCIDYKLSEASIRDGLLPSCDKDPVALWGNFFPVYSKEHDKIYKNAECALCHNTIDVIPWLPILVCKDTNSNNKLPISQQVQFLERNLLSSNCYIAFHFSDPYILANKRCYHELISTCKLPSQINTIPAETYTNLSSTDIREACESGLNSPVRNYAKMYRNIFCYFCNVRAMSRYQATSCTLFVNQKTTIEGGFSVLLKSVYFKKMNHDGVSDEKIEFPEACVRNGPSLMSDRCRNILCPSGQIRTRTGCKFPSIKWYVDDVFIFLRLNYAQSKDSILTLFKQDIVNSSYLKERFLEKTPWASLWKITTIMHIDEIHSEKSVSIMMTNKLNSPAKLFHSIKRSMVKPWTISLNGSSFIFDQSLLEYSVTWSSDVKGNIPVWVRHANIPSLLQMNISSTESEKLHLLYFDRLSSSPRFVTKLFLCEHISLYSGEYDLTARNTVLISNLTVHILYDMEFELVYDVNSTVTVRVCLSDTVFKTKHDTNGSQKELFGHSAISMTVALFVWMFADDVIFSIPMIF